MKKLVLIMFLLVSIMVVGIQPVFAVGDIVGPDIIYKDSNEIVSISDITSLYTSTGGVVIPHEDGFTGKGNIVGEHEIVLKATDGLLDKFKTVKVIVTNNKIPDIDDKNLFSLVGKTTSSNSFVFVTLQDKTINLELIRDTLIALSQISIVEPSSKQIITDTYSDNKTTPGTYDFNFRILDSTGVIRNINTKIKVLQISEDWIPLDPIVTPGIIDINFDFISVIISWVIAVLVFIGVIFVFIYSARKFKKGVR